MIAQSPVRPKQARPSSKDMFSPVAAGVGRLTTVFVNLYAVDLPDGTWALIDTGLPRLAWYVRRAVESRYGAGARPAAIILTHGHFDHAGNAWELADEWDVPVYAHRLEMPYLTGLSDYPPQDPTPGGAISFLSRFFPTHGIGMGDRIHVLPDDGSVPGLPGWRWVHTAGHTPGHVSLFRDAGGVLLAGDALATTDLDAWTSQFTWPRELSRPPTPLTPDWAAAGESIHRLADLEPWTVAAGHGLPIRGPMLGDRLRAFAAQMRTPAGGRYTGEPARYAADGAVASVPPPVPDPLPWKLAAGGAIALAAIALLASSRRSNNLRDRFGAFHAH